MNKSIPQHIYGLVDQGILCGSTTDTRQYEHCVIFGVTSIPSRALHFSILCESGAQWARIPLHKLRHEKPTSERIHELPQLQSWDCHGWDFCAVQYEYLREMGCKFKTRDGEMVSGSYWFTLDHMDNGYSQYPPEHKCYHMLLLDDGSGQIAAQPNNRIVWRDDSFVRENQEQLNTYRVMPEKTWHAELGRNADLNKIINEEASKSHITYSLGDAIDATTAYVTGHDSRSSRKR
jgi:hypothetical protein